MTSQNGPRVALAIIAIICGGMGFVESIAAAPAQSTALAADALLFLRESVLAWLAMWISIGAFRRSAIVARLIGFVMIALGAGVVVIALARLKAGSAPEPMAMFAFAAAAFFLQPIVSLFALRGRSATVSPAEVWRSARDACVAHLCVIGAAAAVYLAHTNMGDIAVGAAIAALFTLNGIVMLVRGRLMGPAEG
jgi:hypothetical protein